MKFGSLRITTADGRTREYPIDLPTLVVGRADGNNIVIDDLSVARRHARLTIDSGRLMVEDLSSANGTFINGERLPPNTPSLAEPGAEIRFGEAIASYTPASGSEGAGASADGDLEPGVAPEPLELPPAIHASLNIPPDPIDPGGAGMSALLTVQNRGRVVDELVISVENLPPEWVALSAEKVVLLPGASAVITLMVQPPRHSASLAGHYDFAVVVRSLETGREVLAQGQVLVRQFNGLGLSLDPVRSKKDFSLRVENQANALMTYALVGRDDEEAFQYQFERPTVELSPGTAAELKVRVEPKKRKLFGTQKAIPFTLTASSTTFMGDKAETGGELIVHPPLEPLKRPAMFSVFLVLAAAAAFAFFFLAGNQDTKAVSPEAAYAGVHMCDKGGKGENPVPTPADAPAASGAIGGGQAAAGQPAPGNPGAGAPYFMQNDPRWGQVEYAKAADPDFGPDWCGSTIAQCGCAMTSVTNVMAIFQLLAMPDGQPLTPQTVNAWFNLNARKTARGWVSQGYIYGDVIWTAVNQLSGEIAAKNPGARTLRFAGTGTGSDAEITAQLKQQRPVVLEVPGHWIIAYGLDGDKIKIHDPYYADRQVLQDSYAGKVRSSVLFEPSEDLSAVVITVPADTRIRVTDKQGRVVGTLNTGSAQDAAENAKHEIPGASYATHQAWRDPTCVESAPPQGAGTNQIVLPGRREDYKIEVLETSGGPTSVSIHTYDRNGQPAIQVLDNNTGGLTADLAFDPNNAKPQIDVVNKKPVEQDSSARTAGPRATEAQTTASPSATQAASPTAAPTSALQQTTLSVSVPAGATVVPVASNAGFAIGDIIRFSPGNANEEDNRIVGFGSFILGAPLKFAHSAGETIVRISAGTGGAPPPVDTGSGGLEPKPPDHVGLNCSSIYSASPKNATLICSTTITGTFTTTRWTIDGRVQPQLNGKTVMLQVYTLDALTAVSVTACNVTLCASDQATQAIRFPSSEALGTATPTSAPTPPPPTVSPPPSGGGVNINCNLAFDTTPAAIIQCASASNLKHTSISWSAPGLTPPGTTGQDTGYKGTASPGDLKPGTDGNATVEVSSTWCNLSDCTKSAPLAIQVPYATTSLSLLPSTVVQGTSLTMFAVITGPVVPSGGRVTFKAAPKGTNDFQPLGLDVRMTQLPTSGFASMTVQTSESFLSEGDYDVIAEYSGGTNIFGGQSAKVALQVTPPVVDICNSVDDNGNGKIDENCTLSDSSGSTQKAIGSGVILSGTQLNGQNNGDGTPGVFVGPGDTFTVSFGVARQAQDPCPDCTRQVYLGIGENTGAFPRVPPVGPACVMSEKLPDPNTSVPKNISHNFTAPTTPGIYYIRATASLQASCGRPDVGGPDSSIARIVVQASTATSQTVPASTVLGDTIRLSAVVRSPATGNAWPGTIFGVVQFCDWWGVTTIPTDPTDCATGGGTVLATAPVQRVTTSGVTFQAAVDFDTHALYSTFGTPVGTHQITAIYLEWPGIDAFNGPVVYKHSSSTSASLRVDPARSQIGVSLGAPSVALGSPVAMIAALSTPPEFGQVCGTIDFMDGANLLKSTQAAENGLELAAISYDTTELYAIDPTPIGTHNISVRYQSAPCGTTGASNYANATSSDSSLGVTAASTSVNVTFNPTASGQLASMNIEVTATVTSGAFGSFNGSVAFSCDGASAGSAVPVDTAPVNGTTTAVFKLDTAATWTALPAACKAAGAHAWTAVYTPGANSNYAGATSAAASYTFTAATTSVSIDVPATDPSAKLGAFTTVTAVVTSDLGPRPFGDMTGVVEFRADSATLLCTGSVRYDTATNRTVASCSADTSVLYVPTGSSPIGTHPITGTYIPSGGNYAQSPASSPVTLTVTASTTTMDLTVLPNTVALGADTTLTATVHGGAFGPFGGTVTFKDETKQQTFGPVTIGADGVATFALDTSTLYDATNRPNPVGSHVFGATYAGGTTSNYADASVTTNQTLTVNAAPTTMTLTANPIAVPVGGSVQLTAQLSAENFGSFAGGIDFYENATKLTSTPVAVSAGGLATFPISNVSAGSHTYTAQYVPATGSNYAASTSNAAQVLGQVPTINALTVSPNPVVTPNSVTFTADISCPSCGTQPSLTGSVDFFDGVTLLNSGPIALSGNKATLTLQTGSGTGQMSVGSHIISARYYGSGQYSGSDSSLVRLVVKANTTTTMVTSTVDVLAGNSASVTAAVTSTYAGKAMTGDVEFYVDGATTPAVTMGVTAGTNGNATATASINFPANSTLGPHAVTARYLGDSTFAESTSSNSTSVTVQHPTTVHSIVVNPSDPVPSTSAGAISFTVTVWDSVTNAVATGLNGNVDFFVDGSATASATATISNGGGTSGTVSLTAGSHTVTAQFKGGGNYAASSLSSAATFKVLAATQVTNFTAAPNPVEQGKTLTLSAKVVINGTSTGVSGGTLNFKDGTTTICTVSPGNDGTATCTGVLSTVGSHSITAEYKATAGGAYEDSTSLSALSVTVLASTSTSVTTGLQGSNPLVNVTVSSLTAGTFTGNAELYNGSTLVTTSLVGADGTVTIKITNELAPGTYTCTVRYTGGGQYAPSTSPPFSLTVP